MSASEAPSPQAELRAEIDRFIFDRFDHCVPSADLDDLMALFAARVAAIEARVVELETELHTANLSCRGYRKERDEADARTDKAEADLAAMTKKADTYQRMYYAEHGEIAAELDQAKVNRRH